MSIGRPWCSSAKPLLSRTEAVPSSWEMTGYKASGMKLSLQCCILPCHSHRRRHKLTKLRCPTTDRRPLTDAQCAELEQWKLDYMNLIQRPTEYGIVLPPGHLQMGIPEELQLAVDESPLQYVPACKGTYEQHNCKTVYVFAQNDKRQITTSPVLQRSGQAPFSRFFKRSLDLAAYCSIN